MRVCIHRRTDTPWVSMTLESFRAQSSDINLPRDSQARVRNGEVIELWQEATGLDYFGYRETLKRVCEREHDKTFPLMGLSEEGIIVPVDDDDIITQAAAVLPRFFLPDVNVVTWTRVTVVHGKERNEKTRYYLDSCNWAIRRGFLETFPVEEQSIILGKHQQANRILQLRAGIANRVPGAVTNRDGSPITLTEFLDANREKTLEGCPWVLDIQETFSKYYLHSASISYLCQTGITVDKVRAMPLHPLFDINVYNQVMKERGTYVRSQAV